MWYHICKKISFPKHVFLNIEIKKIKEKHIHKLQINNVQLLKKIAITYLSYKKHILLPLLTKKIRLEMLPLLTKKIRLEKNKIK